MSCLTMCEKNYCPALLETLNIMPVEAISSDMDVPPALKNGSGSPVVGITPITTAMLSMACTVIMAVSPAASRQPYRSGQETAVTLHAPERLNAFQQLQTQPHPGFPTDMQVQMLALATLAKGTSVIVENVFENRFTHAGDLNRMGANVMVNGRTAVAQGVEALYGARVAARDLRGGAALAIAGLRARGETLVEHAELIDRGYERLEDMLSALGADIRRVSVEA